MPFDGADYTRIEPLIVETPAQGVIRRARALISERAGWSNRTFREGEAFCILGALREAHHGDAWRPGTGGAQDYVQRVLRRRGYGGITTFNDRYALHKDVVAVLDAAYELAGKPKHARLDLSRLPRRGVASDRFKPLPPPIRLGADRPSVADIVGEIAAANAAAAHEAQPPPSGAGPILSAIDALLLSALSFAFRRAV